MKNRCRLAGVALMCLGTVSAIGMFSSSTDSPLDAIKARDEAGVQPLPASSVSFLPEGFTMPEQGLTRQQRNALPEDVRFAAGIHNNFIVGGFNKTLNWTTATLGRDPSQMLTTCTKPSFQGQKLCARVPMPTPWSDLVDLEDPLPEYPRPQMHRSDWLSLNGVWEFRSRGVSGMKKEPFDVLPAQRIIVPFPVEAPLSGVAHHDVNSVEMQYKRNFTVPGAWKGKRVLLHFGAVDHTATVIVNGQDLGTHVGGYDKFSVDITDVLQDSDNLLVVEVFDPTEFAHIPIGKQRLHPGRHPSGIMYTSASGIWQTVWLEPVPEAYIERLDLIPNIDTSSLSVLVHGSQATQGMSVNAVASSKGKEVGSSGGIVGTPFDVKIADMHLWSPEDPFLYDLDVSLEPNPAMQLTKAGFGGKAAAKSKGQLRQGRGAAAAKRPVERRLAEPVAGELQERRGNPAQGRGLNSLGGFLERYFKQQQLGRPKRRPAAAGDSDSVEAYFGMRKSSMGRTKDGALRPMLNNEFVFQTGMLDQGFWPDGIYTAPTDEALASDISFSKELGFNLLRKHTKVESDRWYFHADRLGILVWQDMPSMFFQAGPEDLSLNDKRNYKTELRRLIEQHLSVPSIVAWVVFNEGWGQHDTEEVVTFAQSFDTSRVFDGASGWVDFSVGDFIDMHNYVGPGSPLPTEKRAAVLGEFGGLGLRVEGHMWIPEDAFAYEMKASRAELEDRYVGLVEKVGALMVDPKFGLSASVYTELTDCEAEINGFITYDRQVKKVDPKVLFKANQRLIAESRALNAKASAISATSV